MNNKVSGGYWYHPTSLGTLNPSFTKTSVLIPGGSITIYVREGIELSNAMIKLLNLHYKPEPLPPPEGGIQRSND